MEDEAAEVALPLKVLVLGDPAVGKTAYVRRLVRGQGSLGEAGKQGAPADCFKKGYKPSKGVDFALKEFEVDGRTARLQVWDASGEHARRGEVPDVYYQDAFGALLVYDITRPTTFDTVLAWKRDIDERMVGGNWLDANGQPTGPPVILVGAKCDLETASADTAELDRFCADHGFYGWFDVSARTGFNVDTCARCLAEKILDDEYNVDHKVAENARFRPADVFADDDEEGSWCAVA